MTSNRIEQAARVIAQHRLATPRGGTSSGAFVLCGCGTVINGASRDHAYIEGKRHLARALDEAGLLADGHITLHTDEAQPRAIPVPMPCRRCGWRP